MTRSHRWRRIVLALAVAAMGVIDLLSVLLSHASERLLALRDLVPTEVLDTSRTFTLLAGVLLLFTAWGLAHGKRRAFVTALWLSAVSVPVNLLKAFDFEEATVAAGLMLALGLSAEAFTVKSRELSLRGVRSWAIWFALGLAIYAVLGCWLLERTFGMSASFAHAIGEAAYQLFGVGSSSLALRPALPPFEQRVVTWFLDSLPVSALTLLGLLAGAALRPVAHRGRHHADIEQVRALAIAHGDSSVVAFALDPANDYFFSPNRRAVIAYRFESDTLLAIGDPIGPLEELAPLLAAFEEFCHDHDWQFAFFQARPERLALYQSLGWRALHIGEDPILKPDQFSLEGSAVGNLRRGVRKVEEAGIEVRTYRPDDRPFEPANDPDGMLADMRALSAEWLRHHAGGEKGFCMGRFEPSQLGSAWLLVGWNPARRRVEAFTTWVPIWGRRGWALDLMRRRSDAVAGVTELLIVRSVDIARARGDAVLSLSLSALARVGAPESEAEPGTAPDDPATRASSAASPLEATASEPDRARAFLMKHLARFYDFENLFRWKKKFAPTFEDRYLVYPDPIALPRVVLALVRAQSPGGLMSYLARRPDA